VIRVLGAHETDIAASVLRNGGLLGLPTETVYGLAANAESAEAVSRIYFVKGRPQDHPVIVHIASVDQLSSWAREIPDYARSLAEEFWPGPMTLVLKRTGRAADFITGGQDTVGIRIPQHPVALAVIAEFGGGVAAPSANRFGGVSPTSAQHVIQDLSNRLDGETDAVIDGGESEVGVESTIIDCTSSNPRVLRLGAVTVGDIERVTGLTVEAPDDEIRAPGTLASHYSPHATVVLAHTVDEMNHAMTELISNRHIGVIALEKFQTPRGGIRLAMPQDATEYAAILYAALWEADRQGLDYVVALVPDGADIAAAVRDRLTRAAH
jgi:L-threonylcarbamoyladenylate synthase